MEYTDYEEDLKNVASRVVKRNKSSIRHLKRIDPSESGFNDFNTQFDRIEHQKKDNLRKKNDNISFEKSVAQTLSSTRRSTSVEAALNTMANFDEILNNEFNNLSDYESVKVNYRNRKRSKSSEDLFSTVEVDDNRSRSNVLDNMKQILNHESRHLVLLTTINKFKQTLKESKVNEETLTNIFCNIEDLIAAQSNLVLCLENIVSNWDVTENQFTDVMDLYVLLHMHCKEYVKNIINSTRELKELFLKNEKICDAMKIVLYEGYSLRLEELLAKPTNWLCNSLENIKTLIETADGDNNMKVARETLGRLRNSTEYRTRLPPDLIEKNQFLRSGLFVELLPNDQRKLRHVFLFSRMLICANQFLQTETNMIHAGNLDRDSKKSCHEYKNIERLDVRWFIPIEKITIHPTTRLERCEKHTTAITNLKNKIKDLKVQLFTEKPKVTENFPFYKIGMKKDVDKIPNQIMRAQADLLLLSPTIVFHVGSLSEKPHNLLVLSIKDLEIWKRDIITSKKSLNETDTSMNHLLDINHFLDTYRGNPSVIEVANFQSMHYTNENGISGVVSTTICSVEGLNPVYNYYLSIEADSFNINEVKAITKKLTNGSALTWNETFDIDLDCSHTMNIILYEVKNYAQEKESLLGYFEFKLDMRELDNKTIMKKVPNFREDEAFLQIKVSFKMKSRSDLMSRQPSMMKTSLFGISLGSIVAREKSKCNPPIENVPMILQTCLGRINQIGMDEEGIYRICGSKNEISEFYKRLNKNVMNALGDIEKYELHTITSIVKLYLRELPEPLMMTENYRPLLEISNNADEDERYRCYSEVIQRMPEPNHSTVLYILNHFKRVCAHSNRNQMIASNLGLIIGPTLMMPPSSNDNPKGNSNFAIETMNSMYLSRVLTQMLNGISSGKVVLDQ